MRFLLANSFVVLALSGILYYQYFYQSPETPASMASIVQQRTPAAAPTELPNPISPKPLSEKKPVELDWKYRLNCKDSEKSVSQKRDSLILNIQKCEKEFPKQIIVENQTNGFTASIFAVSDTYSKTDSIPLKKGKNVIVIKYQTSKARLDIVEKISVEY